MSMVALGTLVVASPSAGAQVAASSGRWLAWVGCWRPDDPTQLPLVNAPVVCVVPTSTASAVDIVTVDSGKVVSRYTVDASGAQRSVNRDGCTGWERARWSSDSLRVFLNSELACGALKRSSTGIMSITRGGEWVGIDAVTAGGNEAVRATRYRDVQPSADLPADVTTAATLGPQLGRRAAALAAGAALTPSIIVEATHALDTAAVQAWLVERHETYELDPKTLIALADAGVPGSVTDVMVAASYPDEFHFNRGPAPAMMGDFSARDSARIAADYLLSRNCDPLSYYSPYSWGINPCSSSSYSYRYGYPGYRYGAYGYGYGYGGYGYGSGYDPYYYGGAYGGPVVIISNGSNNDAGVGHGRAVKGQGYTRGGSSSGSSGASGSYAPSSSSQPSSASSGSSSGSGSSAGSSSSSGRTAIPKPPSL